MVSLKLNGKPIRRLNINGKKVVEFNLYGKEQINAQAIALLDNAQFLGTDSYTYLKSTYTYNVYETFEPIWSMSGLGRTHPFAISQHILASAKHYGEFATGNINLFGKTFKMNQWITLTDWLVSIGKSDLIRGLNVDDIILCKLDKSTTVDDNCIPYYMSQQTLDKLTDKNGLIGTIGWRTPQKAFNGRNLQAPIIFTSDASWATTSAAQTYIENPEYKQKLMNLGNTYLAYSGDSGKPAYIMVYDKPILVSACTTTVGGPQYIKAFEALKAVVEDYDDTIKEFKL